MFHSPRIARTAAALLAVGLGMFLAAPAAQAGCGCDHPPPAWSPVMPPFASPGKTIRIHLEGADLRVGRTFDVRFGNASSTRVADGIAVTPDTVEAVLPNEIEAGPTSILVDVWTAQYAFSEDLFTALAPAPVIAATGGTFQLRHVKATVTQDGTLLLPVNVRHVQDAMQFAFQFDNLSYEFGPDDVVLYNSDGLDLTLFTLAVQGQSEMQWGSYYGWEVEDDTGLFGTVYDQKVKKSSNPGKTSDILTYWRHEFHTYTQAHLPCGSHEVTDGFHPDGTLHVNHGYLVLAIHGLKRSSNDPLDPSNLELLPAGNKNVTVNVLAVPAENPIEPDVMAAALESSTSFEALGQDESHFDEFEGMGSGTCESSTGNGGSGGKGKKK